MIKEVILYLMALVFGSWLYLSCQVENMYTCQEVHISNERWAKLKCLGINISDNLTLVSDTSFFSQNNESKIDTFYGGWCGYDYTEIFITTCFDN